MRRPAFLVFMVVACGSSDDAPNETPSASTGLLDGGSESTDGTDVPASSTGSVESSDDAPEGTDDGSTESGDDTGPPPQSCSVPWSQVECTQPAPSAWAGCDPFAQDCADGQRCVPISGDTGVLFECVPVAAAPAGLHEPCLADGFLGGGDSCDEGLYCRNWMYGTVGSCQPLCGCGPAVPTCPDGYACDSFMCVPACDPLQNECGASSGCYPVPHGTLQAYGCFRSGSAAGNAPGQNYASSEGQACEYQVDCLPGLMCREGVCRRYCDVEATEACPDGRACESQPFASLSPECLQHVGLCALPP